MALIIKLSKHNNTHSKNKDINNDNNQRSIIVTINYFKTKGLVGPAGQLSCKTPLKVISDI